MANGTVEHRAKASPVDERESGEMTIGLWYEGDMATYRGARATLEAESVVPPGTTWPSGEREVHWELGPVRFRLFRTRPLGMKGPKRLWVEGDFWEVRSELIDDRSLNRRSIAVRQAAVEEAIHWESPAGRREAASRCKRHVEIHTDQAYAAFKALIPALSPAKRGRKPGTSTQGAQQ